MWFNKKWAIWGCVAICFSIIIQGISLFIKRKSLSLSNGNWFDLMMIAISTIIIILIHYNLLSLYIIKKININEK
jgi:hypothetical protein